MASDQSPVRLVIELTPTDAEQLYVARCRDFSNEQPDRFGRLNPANEATHLSDATLFFCGSVADALLLRAYERQRGYMAALMWDSAAGMPCVVSERSPVSDAARLTNSHRTARSD